jgi:hypothetical protein
VLTAAEQPAPKILQTSFRRWSSETAASQGTDKSQGLLKPHEVRRHRFEIGNRGARFNFVQPVIAKEDPGDGVPAIMRFEAEKMSPMPLNLGDNVRLNLALTAHNRRCAGYGGWFADAGSQQIKHRNLKQL